MSKIKMIPKVKTKLLNLISVEDFWAFSRLPYQTQKNISQNKIEININS
jgi:hypothetical protein